MRRPGRVPPSSPRPGLASRASDAADKAFMTQIFQFENRLSHHSWFFGCTVSRNATSVEPSKTSSKWSQVRQRNSPRHQFDAAVAGFAFGADDIGLSLDRQLTRGCFLSPVTLSYILHKSNHIGRPVMKMNGTVHSSR
jgi:hypothetical protein